MPNKSSDELAAFVRDYVDQHGCNKEQLASGVSLGLLLQTNGALLFTITDIIKEYYKNKTNLLVAGSTIKLDAAAARIAVLENRLVQAEARGFEHDRRSLDNFNERLAAIERGGVRYRGTFQKAESYHRGDLTTFDGAIWCAVRDTVETPNASKDWSLAVKTLRGADGKAVTMMSSTIALKD